MVRLVLLNEIFYLLRVVLVCNFVDYIFAFFVLNVKSRACEYSRFN